MTTSVFWHDKDSTGWREDALRKQFYGYSAGVGENTRDTSLSGGMKSLSDQLTTNGVYEDVISGFLQIPYSRFNENTIRRYSGYSKEALAYLQDGLEAFDIDTEDP